MPANYFFRKTKTVEDKLFELEVLRKAISLLPELPHVEENLRRQSQLKSSLFSARIEGSRLRIDEVRLEEMNHPPESLAKKEIFNILHAQRWLFAQKGKIDEVLIKKLHSLVMSDLTAEEGSFRLESSAIFNQAGVAIYLTPPPQELPELLHEFISCANSKKAETPITAAKSHFLFEKIHPFIDGNGRVGRLVSSYILFQGGFGFRGLVSLEEYLEKEKEAYYDLLAKKDSDITDFIEFFLQGLVVQTHEALEQLKNYREEKKEDCLLPRRREILEIIRDHGTVSFDFLVRRFLRVSSSTLHFDLKKLLGDGLIRKLGSTRGVVYQAK